MTALASYILAMSMLADPCVPASSCYGDVIRDDHGCIMIVGEIWIGVGKVQPSGKAFHVVWTHRRNGHETFAYPAYYSWDAVACQWRGYYGRSEDPYTVEEIWREKP